MMDRTCKAALGGATLLVGVGALSGVAQATTVNLLAAGSAGSLNGALFETSDIRTSGTGVIQPFLRMQHNGTEQGYNTSGRPVAFDELTDPNFTRNMLLGDLGTLVVNGTSYYEFLLDVNEPNGGGQELISLEQLRIYTGKVGSLTTGDTATLGALRYDMDAGDASNVVRINDLNTGSGEYDVRILVPVSAFAASLSSDFLYLFARFGDTDSSNAGFEEFAGTARTLVIPLPGAAGLGMAGFAGLAVRRRRGI